MSHSEMLSVLLLCYKHEHLLPRTLAAFKNQTEANFELVLVDNKSPDHSVAVMKKFKDENPQMNIVIIENKSSIVAEGRRAGFENSHGEYVMFHDGDDWLEENCIQRYYETLQANNNPDCVVGCTKSVDDSGKTYFVEKLSKKSSVWQKNTLQGVALRRKILESVSTPFCNTFFEDFYTMMCIKPCIKSVAFLDEALYCYYRNADSASSNSKTKVCGYWTSLFEDLCCSLKSTREAIQQTPDWTLCEYQFISHFYSLVFAGSTEQSLKEKFLSYQGLRSVMMRHFPLYLKNKNIKLFAENYDVGTFKKNIWVASRMERLDQVLHTGVFMWLLLWIYHLALRVRIYKVKH